MNDKGRLFGLKTSVIEQINRVFSDHPKIEQVLIYGSRAKGNYLPGSDIDLVIQGNPLTLSQLMRIENELDDLLLPYKIDLSQLCNIDNDDLVDHINRVGKVFYLRRSDSNAK